jgi:hypothetical protein
MTPIYNNSLLRHVVMLLSWKLGHLIMLKIDNCLYTCICLSVGNANEFECLELLTELTSVT